MNSIDISNDRIQQVRAHIGGLLRRYPDLPEGEAEELISFLASGPIAEVGFVTGDPDLRPLVERVKQDHARRFNGGIGNHILVALLLVIPMIALCWYIWDRGA